MDKTAEILIDVSGFISEYSDVYKRQPVGWLIEYTICSKQSVMILSIVLCLVDKSTILSGYL